MAVRGINLTRTIRFVSAQDPEKGQPGETVFILRPLDGYQASYLNDLMIGFEQLKTGDQATKVNMGRVSLETIQLALKEAENFLGADGMPIEIVFGKRSILGREYSAVSPEVMAQIHPDLLQEMYGHYQQETGLTAGDAKKSA